MSLDWKSSRGRPITGVIDVPGDKSISHRALMLAALADGTSNIDGFLEGEDTRATARILQQLGVQIETPGPGQRRVHGVGLHGLKGTDSDLDCGNAGTGMRLLAGLLAGQAFASRLVGDASLSRRPMGRITAPLARMGARIETREGGLPPITIHVSNGLQGIDYKCPVASAQVKSATLLAGLYAQGQTSVIEPQPTRDYTERMLAAFGYPIVFKPGFASLKGGGNLRATDVSVPSDFSSAAFFLVAASVVPASDLLVRRVGMNPRRTGLLAALRLMGADITEVGVGEQGGEPVADLRVRYAPLHGINLPTELVPDMIDEFPALFVAAALACGVTRIEGVAELRVKESDRLAVMSHALQALGCKLEETADGAVIEGGVLHGGRLDSHGDHRIAMSLAIAGQVASGDVEILDCANVDTSFPGFLDLASGIGFSLDMA
jgi:3-phosphoshikimate 1-carboxyvinyltransferase